MSESRQQQAVDDRARGIADNCEIGLYPIAKQVTQDTAQLLEQPITVAEQEEDRQQRDAQAQ